MTTTTTTTAAAPGASAARPAASASPLRWRVLMLLFALSTINGVDRIALPVGIRVIGPEFELSPAVQGIVLSSFFWTYCLFQVPSGWAVDRWGARRVIGWAAGLWGLCQCAASLAVGGVTLILARLGLGTFEAPMMPAASRLVASWFPDGERSRSVTLIDAGAPIGSAIGGLVLAQMIALFDSWRTAFFVVGAATVVYAAFLFWRLRDPATDAATDREPPRAASIAATPAPAMSPRTFAAMVVGRIGWTLIFFGLATWGPKYLADARGFDLEAMGYATFAIFMAGGVGAIVSGALADWLQRLMPRDRAFKLLFGLSGAVVLGGFVALPYVADPTAAVALLSMLMLFHFFGSLYWTIPAMLAPRERIGLVGGVMNFAGTSGGIAAPLVIGFIVQATGGYDTVIAFFVGCAAVYLAGSLLIDFRRAEDRAR